MDDVRNVLEARFPGLHAAVERLLVDSEARYNHQTNQAPSEFLLDHTRRTAAIAYRISGMEGVDPFLPLLVALFHDAGNFHDAEYHKDAIREEGHAGALAEKMLPKFGVADSDFVAVREARRALYNDKPPCAGACRIVQ